MYISMYSYKQLYGRFPSYRVIHLAISYGRTSSTLCGFASTVLPKQSSMRPWPVTPVTMDES